MPLEASWWSSWCPWRLGFSSGGLNARTSETPNAPGSTWRPPRGSRRHSSGRRASLPLLLILAGTFGCGSHLAAPTWVPQVPERPALQYPLQAARPCRMVSLTDQHVLQDGECYLIWKADWDAIRTWYLLTDRELKTSCLAAGGTPERCRTQ